MGNYIDLTGKRFGRLTVLEKAPSTVKNGRYETWFNCKCDCGNIVTVRGRHLRYGHVNSCGCLEKENLERIHQEQITHNESKSRLYNIWNGMHQRCENKNNSRYSDYGMRGISVSEKWKHYESFKEWAISHGYKNDLTIERIDNDLGYSPENCCWIPMEEQAGNKRTNRVFIINGDKFTIAKLAEKYGIPYQTLWARLNVYHWPVEKAITASTSVKGVA